MHVASKRGIAVFLVTVIIWPSWPTQAERSTFTSAYPTSFLEAQAVTAPLLSPIDHILSSLGLGSIFVREPIGNSGQRFSGAEFRANARIPNPSPEVDAQAILEEFYTKGYQWISGMLMYHQDQLPTATRELLQNLVLTLSLMSPGTPEEDIRFDPKPFKASMKNRLIASRQEGRKKYIALNPFKLNELRLLLRQKNAGFFAATLLLHEAAELLIEDPERNSWSNGIDEAEPWTESLMLELEHTLLMLCALSDHPSIPLAVFKDHSPYFENIEPSILRQKTFDLKEQSLNFLNREYADAYWSLMNKLNQVMSPLLSTAISEEDIHVRWNTIYEPYMTTLYGKLALDAQDISDQWRWAITAISDEDIIHERRQFLQIRPKELRRTDRKGSFQARIRSSTNLESVYEYAQTIYKNKTMADGTPVMEHCMTAAENLNRLYQKLGIGAPENLLALLLLQRAPPIPADYPAPAYLKTIMSQKNKSLARFESARQLVYQPPSFTDAIGSRDILNYQELVAKVAGSMGTVLLVMADDLAMLNHLEDKAQIEYLERKMIQIYGRFPGFSTSKPTDWLLDQTFRTIHAHRHMRLMAEIKNVTKLSERERKSRLGHLAKSIKRTLRNFGFKDIRVLERDKSTHAIQRKLMVKAHDYPRVSVMQDLLAFILILNTYVEKSIPKVLETKEILRLAVDQMMLRHFPGQGLINEQTEEHARAGHKPFHMTPLLNVKGFDIPVEAQIFMDQDQFDLYEQGPDAHRVHKIRQQFKQRTNYASYKIDKTDPEATFKSFLRTLEPWLYIQVADSVSWDNTAIWTHRILQSSEGSGQERQLKGNLADIAALKNELDENFQGADLYTWQRDPETKTNKVVERGRGGPAFVPQQAMVLVFDHKARSRRKKSSQQINWQAVIDTSSEIRTLLHLYNFKAAQLEGQKKLIKRIKEKTGRNVKGLREEYTKQVLNSAAVTVNARLNSGDEVLAFFGINRELWKARGQISDREIKYIEELVDEATLERGREILSKRNVLNHPHLITGLASHFGYSADKASLEKFIYAVGSMALEERELQPYAPIPDTKYAHRSRLTARERLQGLQLALAAAALIDGGIQFKVFHRLSNLPHFAWSFNILGVWSVLNVVLILTMSYLAYRMAERLIHERLGHWLPAKLLWGYSHVEIREIEDKDGGKLLEIFERKTAPHMVSPWWEPLNDARVQKMGPFVSGFAAVLSFMVLSMLGLDTWQNFTQYPTYFLLHIGYTLLSVTSLIFFSSLFAANSRFSFADRIPSQAREKTTLLPMAA